MAIATLSSERTAMLAPIFQPPSRHAARLTCLWDRTMFSTGHPHQLSMIEATTFSNSRWFTAQRRMTVSASRTARANA